MTDATSATLNDLTGGDPIIILAPHPDDESLGCGGLIAACRANGIAVHVVSMTDGAGSHPNSVQWADGRLAAQRRSEMLEALKRLGCAPGDVTFLGHPDTQLASVDQDLLRDQISALCDRVGARTIFAASAQDPHCDHEATAAVAAALVAMRPDTRLWYYPVWSRWHDPQYRTAHQPAAARVFDTQAWSDAKHRAVNAHASQLGGIVKDDPTGFTLDRDFVRFFIIEPEIYFEGTP
ncbi:PIG-L deacetylase family protein [Pseudosulfitobacter koreensis]|uniref:PIG-L family deacetylase n=1 Tax=Pseudosulfitobacter koreensis TaxID=2968472 RepID=A0ABT1Z0M9_9RHOB|nr:PIG-L family deacetylase [Pseudosulfitobacter koreense]MCR8826688.1 PIG-L family deacetylase [Pseudosulfitobacter koreense]